MYANSKVQSPESALHTFISAVCNSHHKLGLSAVNWFVMLLDDIMAGGFGKPLQKPWTDDERKILFELGGLYSHAVEKNPFEDVLGKLYMELSSGYGKKMLGQYFSPMPIAMLMAQLNLNPNIFEENPIRGVKPNGTKNHAKHSPTSQPIDSVGEILLL